MNSKELSQHTQPADNSWPHVEQELRWVCSSHLQGICPSSTMEMTFLACHAHEHASGWCNLSGHRAAASSYTGVLVGK